jgi:GntR family transcriptional regulator
MDAASVSRATVRRATSELAREGILRSRKGRRTFVAREKQFGPMMKVDGFSEIATEAGRKPTSKVLRFSLEPASDQVAELLRLASGAPVYRNERIRLMDGSPVMVERQFLPAHLVPGLTEEDCAGSTYGLMATRYGLHLVDGLETVKAVRPPAVIARHLGLPRGMPVLLGARIIITERGERAEFVTRWVRTDVMSLTFRLVGVIGETQLASSAPVDASDLAWHEDGPEAG